MNHLDCEDPILFCVIYNHEETVIQLSKYSTVGDLKMEINREFGIPPSEQIIDCWYQTPDNDNDILTTCCLSEMNHLIVSSEGNMSANHRSKNETKGEIYAALDFIQKFSSNFDDQRITFHVCRLEDAIKKTCLTTLEKRKILILYFHKEKDIFAKVFADNIVKPEIKKLIEERFFLLGWDVENDNYHSALIEVLNEHNELSALVNFVSSKICAALLVVPVKESIILFSCIKGKVSDKNFFDTLKKAEEFLFIENVIEKDISAAEQSEYDIGSTNYQQLMLDLLGDRDYDSFDYYEFNFLKDKIGYALFGPPQKEDGYVPKQKKKIDFLFDVILAQNNLFAKWKDRVIISFIYNCIEPLPSEKQKRLKKYKDYNPRTDLNPIPIFVLRKCKNSENPCRIFIDDSGRVYQVWNQYLRKNKLPKCEMILPKNGRYEADENGHVKLERCLSPACGIDSKVLYGADVANTAAGLVSGGIFIAAAIPAVTVAPVALIVAGATGIGVGLYSIGRSAYTLYDRNKHKESLSFANSESRGAYLNIVAGSLGFVGAGANVAVSQLAARGFNIGQGASAAVNVIGVANIGVSGINVVNSGYDVFTQWWDENQKPSLLTIVQLSSSILFFGQAVYSFKMTGTIIEESQANTLRDFQDSLRSNRHRKTFNKLLKKTINQNDGNIQAGQAAVIKSLKNIQNKDEVFAALTRSNKLLNKNNVYYSAENGEIKLNGISINMAEFTAMDKNEVVSFLGNLSNISEPSPIEVTSMSSRLQISLKSITPAEVGHLAFNLIKIFGSTEETIQEKIINAVASLVMALLKDSSNCFIQLDQIFPHHDKYVRLFNMVNGYFQTLINEVEKRYQQWLSTRDPTIEEPYFSTLALDIMKRATQIFDNISKVYFVGTNLTEAGVRELIKYFYTWFAKQAITYEEYQQRKQERVKHSGSFARKIPCPDCGGDYYH